jgi:hypothetical protein
MRGPRERLKRNGTRGHHSFFPSFLGLPGFRSVLCRFNRLSFGKIGELSVALVIRRDEVLLDKNE